ncbi:MAG: division/cell wall cluster transcriptional repressor MraZ [Pseudomonadota bacterium]
MHTAFTVAGHDALIARLKDLKYDNPIQREATRRRYIGLARRISVEEGGRFVLAKDLREMLGLEGAVQFVGDGGTFQLWHPDRYAASIALEDALDLDFGSMVG